MRRLVRRLRLRFGFIDLPPFIFCGFSNQFSVIKKAATFLGCRLSVDRINQIVARLKMSLASLLALGLDVFLFNQPDDFSILEHECSFTKEMFLRQGV
jgi:hypothetical protein